MQFSHIIGQQSVVQQLKEMVDNNRLSHALLFIGKEGSGGLPLALAFSSYVVSQSEKNKPVATTAGLFGDEPVAAATSHGAELAEQYIHPDIHYSYPVIPRKSGDKPISVDYVSEWREFIKQYPYGNVYDWLQFIGAENKQGNITAAECADIIRKLNLKSFESEYKILILWMPEYLGNEGNKLLKLIEEPPANTLFILVAENESLVLPTILSRCQTVRIPPIEISDVADALVQRSKLSETQALQIAAVSEGNYREALQLIQHAEEDWQSLLRDWLNSILKTGPIAQVKWVDVVSALGREKQKQFLRYFTHLLEQSIRLRTMGEEHLPLTGAEKDFALRLNKLCDISQQQAITEQLDDAAYHIERNANAKMLFMALTIKLYHIIANHTVIEVG
ncbi:DNA polymerase-3 subunit delta' [Lacibacter cauensis]|uniref:DNA polymerase-3 subunit delta n=1 Tax=Lacibacter cauensis TaxID=510947 RepID=A0A562SK37_9BACT|nr:DNA polymerase III subunit delta' [Lacibacter cauensis]TWI81473.1 DNA polymerase-3 subunit delta' [Lacibacter cauensis]